MNINDFYEDVKVFNNLAGKKEFNEKSLLNQYKLIQEEVLEIKDGIDNKDTVEILDGVVDTLFVVFGMLQQLEDIGCNVYGAIDQVCSDNLLKFPHTLEDAFSTVKFYNNKNVNVYYEFNSDYSKYVIKDENGKIRKPHNFIPTDLNKYIPDNLKKGIL